MGLDGGCREEAVTERWTGVGDQTWRSLAERTANRIRLLQADLADEDAQTRRSIVADEIRAALEKIIPQDREKFLEALEERFPAWESEAFGRAQTAAPAASVSATDMAEFNDPGFLIRQLQKLAEQMSPDQRLKAATELERAGISTGGASGVSPEVMERIRAAVQVEPEAAIDLDRLVSVMSVMLEKVVSLNDIATKSWKQMSHGARGRTQSNLARLVGQYVSNNEQVGSLQISEELESFRRLTASLMLALSQTGQAAYQQMRRLHPEEIEGIIRNEPRSMMQSNEVRCWRKYKELAEAIDPASVEADILRVLAGFVNDWVSKQSR